MSAHNVCSKCKMTFLTTALWVKYGETFCQDCMPWNSVSNAVELVRNMVPIPDPFEQGSDQALIWHIFENAKIGCLKKNLDYGSSAFESPVMMPKLPCTAAILVRMSDKIKRVQSLLDREALVADESIRDTMRDLGTYAFLWLIAEAKQRAGEGK